MTPSERALKWAKDNPERAREHARKYRKNHADTRDRREYMREYYRRNKTRLKISRCMKSLGEREAKKEAM